MGKINKNIEETLKSLDGLERQNLSPLMADRIWKLAMQSPKMETEKTISSKKGLVWFSGLAAVVVLNIAFLNWNGNNQSEDYSQAESSITSIYFDSEISY